ncbi:MAG: hypothetical protein KGI40_08860 [Xanthomonadaceae bacterium]|nr:hypothetical protein [Xanthomonadaceae bacterium]MDE1959181.1 hypothetical protein [Xanthomonadaceae bacterium]MDE2178712.1 hypothetical protein [Xanthomonadaceae bacterium]MDE2246687.1 hypothetical protein [Xanthomonadaceae bacterium]
MSRSERFDPGPEPGAGGSRCTGGGDDGELLDVLLRNLQGNASAAPPDAGLARLGVERLRAIQRGAEEQVQGSLWSLQSLSRLLAVVLEQPSGEMPRSDLAMLAWHISRLTRDMERWRDLANNASFYRIQREAAGTVARSWMQRARSDGEWPEAL